MSSGPLRRTLRDLAEREAPLAPGRAASVMVAVARALERVESTGRDPGELDSGAVVLLADGSVQLQADPSPRGGDRSGDEGPALGTAGGASVGRLLFELLVGRPPLGRDDAFEPAVVRAFSPATCSLLARSLSDAPGQWPDASDWRAALEAEARGLAPPLPPAELAAARRRRTLVALGMAVLVAATLLALLLAPGWWESVSP